MRKTVTTSLLGCSGQGRRSRNGELALSQRHDGSAMANYQAAAAQASQARATAHLPSANPQCDFVCQPYRLPMADVALGLSEVAVYTVFWRWRQAGIWE